MNKARKRRQRRRERDLRWVQSNKNKILIEGTHRYKKVNGVPKGGAFWCPDKDDRPLFNILWHESPTQDWVASVDIGKTSYTYKG